MSLQNSKQISDVKVMLKTGQDGVGINSVTLTNTTGLIDTYTITFDDGRITTFEVTNGSSIQSIEKTGTSGNVDTYTITLTNGNTTTFEVTNGFPATYDSANVTYDNTGTGMSATRVQGAIDELAEDITALQNKTKKMIIKGEMTLTDANVTDWGTKVTKAESNYFMNGLPQNPQIFAQIKELTNNGSLAGFYTRAWLDHVSGDTANVNIQFVGSAENQFNNLTSATVEWVIL